MWPAGTYPTKWESFCKIEWRMTIQCHSFLSLSSDGFLAERRFYPIRNRRLGFFPARRAFISMLKYCWCSTLLLNLIIRSPRTSFSPRLSCLPWTLNPPLSCPSFLFLHSLSSSCSFFFCPPPHHPFPPTLPLPLPVNAFHCQQR